MGKYDNQIGELKNLLPNAKNILITLPTGADIDKFAAGLSLFLAFEAQGKPFDSAQGKQVTIVSEDTIRVAQAHLFGVDHIKNTISSGAGGDLTIVLEGVVSPNGSVPALEKLDWYPEGQNLNLVFKTIPGQNFNPTNITPRFEGAGFDLIFTIGAANLNAMGTIYTSNNQVFSRAHIVNIDTQSSNTSFGNTNINDSNSSSVSEVVVDLLQSLGLPFDQDIASNLLAGIFDVTANLSNEKVGADTYLAVAQALRVGGRKPEVSNPPSQGLDINALFPGASINQSSPTSQQGSNPIFSAPIQSGSAEERPQMEGLNSVDSLEVEPGWLTPKVFKGTSAG